MSSLKVSSERKPDKFEANTNSKAPCIILPFHRLYWRLHIFSRLPRDLQRHRDDQPHNGWEWDYFPKVCIHFCLWKTLQLFVEEMYYRKTLIMIIIAITKTYWETPPLKSPALEKFLLAPPHVILLFFVQPTKPGSHNTPGVSSNLYPTISKAMNPKSL